MWVSTERQWGELVERATWGEASGWHGLWVADHYMSQTPDDAPGDGRILECWTVLGALGALVPRIRLTSMVSPVTIHHPVVLAKRLATVDEITGGRAVLGLGAGWQVNEHRAYGFELPPPGPRVDRFEEAIQVIHHLFHDDRANFAGTYYTLTDAPFAPRPKSVPLLVGTSSPRMLRLTATWADEWNTWGDPAQIATVTAKFNEACEKVGRDPSTIRRSAQAMVFLADDPDRLAKLRERAPAGRSLVGGVGELVDLYGQYAELGVDEVAIPDFTLGATPDARAEAYARLRDDVLSAFA
ncbi:MAG: class flavin-dependent oxidoreductase [Ilumatobacteraceae bacterium]|nr:class flavin-dependent oxidoreductase [Ilumatobacteraceae bacterium]